MFGNLWDCSADPVVSLRFVGSDVLMEEVSRPDNTWIFVKAFFPDSVQPLQCCVLAEDVVEDDRGTRPLEIPQFLKYCTVASIMTNREQNAKDFGINRDYLIALACVLSDLKNAASPNPEVDSFGPFQLTKSDWAEFLNKGNNKNEYSEIDRLNPLLQIDAAAQSTFDATRAISQALTRANADDGLYVPNSIDLFLVHMLGTEVGVDCLKEDQEGRGTKAVSDIVTAKGGDIAALKKRYPRFLAVEGATTIDQVQAIIEREFDAALERAFNLIKEHTPEDLPKVAGTGPSPWFAVAQQELARGVAEPDPRIVDYFRSINFNGATPRTHWCGAFTGFCLKQSGNAQAENSVPSGAAQAARWKGWGQQLPTHATDIPPGAIVVLSPQAPGTSGHVGFFVRANVNSVTLLGGNQDDRVKEATFKRNQVVYVGWLKVEGTGSGGGAGRINLSIVPADRRNIAQMIIDAFKAEGFGLIQQVAALANAIRESSLIPDKRNTTEREDSVGLFQLNMKGGQGEGIPLADLLDPRKNTALIIKQAKKVPAFAAATTIEEAVALFVRKIEITGNQAEEIIIRTNTAKKLLAGLI